MKYETNVVAIEVHAHSSTRVEDIQWQWLSSTGHAYEDSWRTAV